jgi:hypothetical protein
MKKIFLFFVFFFIHVLFSSDESRLKNGYELLQKSDYQAALSQFLSIKQKNAASYMMIADCYQELGHDLLAQGYREKAFVAATVLQKMRMLDQTINNSEGSLIVFSLKKIKHFLYAFAVSVPLIVWQLLFFLVFFLCLFCNNFFVRFGLCLLLICVGLATKEKYDIQMPRVIVVMSQVSGRLVAGENAPIVWTIEQGKQLSLLEQKNGYLKVKKEDGQVGWILAEDVFQIVPL